MWYAKATKRGDWVSYWKKGLFLLMVMAAFLGTTALFTGIWLDKMDDSGAAIPQHIAAFPKAVTEPVWTEPVQTEPVVTEVEVTVPAETEPEETRARIEYEQVPLFYMTDYPGVLYRSGTLATSGSNVASLAMVASYLTGNEYTPAELADYFADYIGNSMQWLEYASDQLQLPWEKAANFHVAKQALQEGKIVITLLGQRSIFTDSQHFIVLTGINEEGRITVNDPVEDHYSQWNLKAGLKDGFPDNSIITGYHGSWIYDPAAMPEEPFLYEPEENPDEFRYPGIELSQEDKDLMAKLICMEAESEPFEGQQAIAEVILNRLAAGNFQSSVKNIIYAQGQFASADRLYLADPTHTQYEAIDRAFNGPYVLPKEVTFFATYKVNERLWGKIGNHYFCYQY